MQIFIGLIIIAASVLQIVLFFKIWGMTNNVKKIKNTLNGGDYYHYLLKGDMEKAYEANLNEAVKCIVDGFGHQSYAYSFREYCAHLGGTKIEDRLELYNERSLRTGKPLPEHLQSVEALKEYMEKLYGEQPESYNKPLSAM